MTKKVNKFLNLPGNPGRQNSANTDFSFSVESDVMQSYPSRPALRVFIQALNTLSSMNVARELTLIEGLFCRGNLTHSISFSFRDSPVGKASSSHISQVRACGDLIVPCLHGTHPSAISLSHLLQLNFSSLVVASCCNTLVQVLLCPPCSVTYGKMQLPILTNFCGQPILGTMVKCRIHLSRKGGCRTDIPSPRSTTTTFIFAYRFLQL